MNGPLVRSIYASLVAGSTYVFPIGKSVYTPYELVDPTTNAGGTVTINAEVFDASTGGTPGVGLSSLFTNRYWNATITNGGANFTNTTVRVTDPAVTLGGGNRLTQSNTLTGTYANIGGNVLSAQTIASSSAVTSLGFLAIGLTSST